MRLDKYACEKETTGLLWFPVVILLFALALQAPLALADGKDVGGHVGFGFPFVTRADGDVTTIADSFRMSLPVAITVSGTGRMYS